MTTLNDTARAALATHGITIAEWAVRNFQADGQWRGSACGCPDNHCAGTHHPAGDECGCLPALLAGVPAAHHEGAAP